MSNNSKVAATSPADSASQKAERADMPDKNLGAGSWGDRWKHITFQKITYTGINYFVNTISSVIIAYAFERKCDAHLRNFSTKVGKKIADFTGFSAEKEANHFYFGTKGFTLTMGGTMLLPVLKHLEDNRRSIEFEIGHKLDVLQDKLGKGNKATAENLAEYKAIKTAIKTHKPVEGLSDEAMKLIGKQHGLNVDCDGKISFAENKLPWSHAIIARGAAWLAAFGTNNVLSRLGVNDRLDQLKGSFTTFLKPKVPGYGRLADPDLFSKNLMNDAILTISSSITQPAVQRVLKHKQSRSAGLEQLECPPNQQPAPQSDSDKQWAKAATDKVMADSSWAKGKTDKLFAGAMKAPVNHKASVESQRENAAEPSIA